jgi:hypothetical protein
LCLFQDSAIVNLPALSQAVRRTLAEFCEQEPPVSIPAPESTGRNNRTERNNRTDRAGRPVYRLPVPRLRSQDGSPVVLTLARPGWQSTSFFVTCANAARVLVDHGVLDASAAYPAAALLAWITGCVVARLLSPCSGRVVSSTLALTVLTLHSAADDGGPGPLTFGVVAVLGCNMVGEVLFRHYRAPGPDGEDSYLLPVPRLQGGGQQVEVKLTRPTWHAAAYLVSFANLAGAATERGVVGEWTACVLAVLAAVSSAFGAGRSGRGGVQAVGSSTLGIGTILVVTGLGEGTSVHLFGAVAVMLAGNLAGEALYRHYRTPASVPANDVCHPVG